MVKPMVGAPLDWHWHCLFASVSCWWDQSCLELQLQHQPPIIVTKLSKDWRGHSCIVWEGQWWWLELQRRRRGNIRAVQFNLPKSGWVESCFCRRGATRCQPEAGCKGGHDDVVDDDEDYDDHHGDVMWVGMMIIDLSPIGRWGQEGSCCQLLSWRWSVLRKIMLVVGIGWFRSGLCMGERWNLGAGALSGLSKQLWQWW